MFKQLISNKQFIKFVLGKLSRKIRPRAIIYCFVVLMLMGAQQVTAETWSGSYRDKYGTTYTVFGWYDGKSWGLIITMSDMWGSYSSYTEVHSGSNNTDGDTISTGGSDPVEDMIEAIKKGDVSVVGWQEGYTGSVLEDIQIQGGSSDGLVPIWNPSDDGMGNVGISGAVGGEELQAILAKIADLKSSTEIYGSGSGGFIDEMGEFNPDWNTGTPPGGGSGGGDGDGDGDGNTDRMASDMGFSSSDDLVIHPQANPAP